MRTLLILMTTLCCLINIVTASRYDDQMHLSIHELEKKYNETEKRIFIEPEKVDVLSTSAAILIRALSLKGGREFLPFYLEKSLDTNLPNYIRQHAAMAYIRVANLDESVELMHQLYNDNSITGSWRYLLNKKLIERIKQETLQIGDKTALKIKLLMLDIVLNVTNSGDANDADQYLTTHMPLYSNSIQRATLSRFATEGSPWCTNTFNPIKTHFDNLPKSQLVDLRKQFPDLPPLPEELIENNKQYKSIVMVGSAVGIFLILGVFFIRYYRKNVP